MNKITTINTNNQTPIEILLQIDENGCTTTKTLYNFLELDNSNYARWLKTNIEKNEFAEKDIDYKVLVINDENPQGGRPTTNYKITASFAKKLAMTSHSEKGEEARNYFIKVEDILKNIAQSKKIQFDNLKVPFKEQVECIDIIANSLRINDASKILMYNTLYKDYNLPTNFLPKYELNGSRELKSATELIKRFELKISTIAFNNLMIDNGYLEEKTVMYKNC